MTTRVLFVCIENSGRSQMAEGFARLHGEGLIDPASAGSRPGTAVNPRAIIAMAERGYDLSTHSPKGLDAVRGQEWDYLVTMGCGDECPAMRATHREDWGLPDPRDMSQEQLNEVRDEIERRVLDLLRRVEARS